MNGFFRRNQKPVVSLEQEEKTNRQSQDVLEDIMNLLERFAEADFTVKPRHPEAFEGKYEPLMEDAQKMVDFISQLARTLKENTNQIELGGQQVAGSMQQLASLVQEQANATLVLEEGASEITEGIQKNAEETKNIAQKCEVTGHLIQETVDEIGGLQQCTNSIIDEIKLAGESLNGILDISKKINILALNAGIEAARAGNNGNGFSVIADQLRDLNEVTRQRVEDIKGSIDHINAPSQQSATMLKAIIGRSQKISENASTIIEASNNIAEISHQQAQSAKAINEQIATLDEMAGTNSGITQEIAATTEQIQAQVLELKAITNTMKVL